MPGLSDGEDSLPVPEAKLTHHAQGQTCIPACFPKYAQVIVFARSRLRRSAFVLCLCREHPRRIGCRTHAQDPRTRQVHFLQLATGWVHGVCDSQEQDVGPALEQN